MASNDPQSWPAPVTILMGGTGHPQVLGLKEGATTDTTADEFARLFMSGTSQHVLRFIRSLDAYSQTGCVLCKLTQCLS